jgi:hypothetical protein
MANNTTPAFLKQRDGFFCIACIAGVLFLQDTLIFPIVKGNGDSDGKPSLYYTINLCPHYNEPRG